MIGATPDRETVHVLYHVSQRGQEPSSPQVLPIEILDVPFVPRIDLLSANVSMTTEQDRQYLMEQLELTSSFQGAAEIVSDRPDRDAWQ